MARGARASGERVVSIAGATGPAPTRGIIAAAATAKLADRQKTQTELGIEAGRKAIERRHTVHLAEPFVPKKSDDGTNVISFAPGTVLAAGNEPIKTGINEAFAAHAKPVEQCSEQQAEPNTGPQGRMNLSKFDHAAAVEFYDAVRPSAFILGFKLGRSVISPEEFECLTKEADDKNEHLFFQVATLKPEWGDPATHEKGRITTATKENAVNMPDGTTSHVLECSYLWSDCDANKYEGTDTEGAKLHYQHEGSRISHLVDKGLARLSITPFAKWRSGAGWQILIKLDRQSGLTKPRGWSASSIEH